MADSATPGAELPKSPPQSERQTLQYRPVLAANTHAGAAQTVPNLPASLGPATWRYLPPETPSSTPPYPTCGPGVHTGLHRILHVTLLDSLSEPSHSISTEGLAL